MSPSIKALLISVRAWAPYFQSASLFWLLLLSKLIISVFTYLRCLIFYRINCRYNMTVKLTVDIT